MTNSIFLGMVEANEFSHIEDDFQTRECQKAVVEKQKINLDFTCNFSNVVIQLPAPAGMPRDMPCFPHHQERALALWNCKAK